jgi:hypothetical protein
MASYQKRLKKRMAAGSCSVSSSRIRFSSKTDAFLDGVGSLLDLCPDPRERVIRAFVLHHAAPKTRSVNEALWGDWVAVGQDMLMVIEAHAPEESAEEAAAGLKATPAR